MLRSLGAYIVIVWLLAQGLVDLLPALGAPDWAFPVFMALAITAAPIIAIIAWRYDLTKNGFLRDQLDIEPARQNLMSGQLGPARGPVARHDGGTSTVLATWTDNHGQLQRCEYYAEFIVGRDFQADIRLSEDCVSRRHLKVFPQGNDWFVEDLGSLNGSFLNGIRVSRSRIENDVTVKLDREGPSVRLVVVTAEKTALGSKRR